jgi:hypothetical protein
VVVTVKITGFGDVARVVWWTNVDVVEDPAFNFRIASSTRLRGVTYKREYARTRPHGQRM